MNAVPEPTRAPSSKWKAIALLMLVAGFGYWLYQASFSQTPFKVRQHQLAKAKDGWYIEGIAENPGPAAGRVYLEVQYYEINAAKHTHRRFVITDVPAERSFGFREGPLKNVDPERTDRYTVYLGLEPSLYGEM